MSEINELAALHRDLERSQRELAAFRRDVQRKQFLMLGIALIAVGFGAAGLWTSGKLTPDTTPIPDTDMTAVVDTTTLIEVLSWIRRGVITEHLSIVDSDDDILFMLQAQDHGPGITALDKNGVIRCIYNQSETSSVLGLNDHNGNMGATIHVADGVGSILLFNARRTPKLLHPDF